MIQTILAFFGYCKIPKESILISMATENLLSSLLDEAKKKAKKNETVDFVKTILEGQKVLTEFLRSGKLLQ